jgi:phosphohistidine swiveling domain-containing protein
MDYVNSASDPLFIGAFVKHICTTFALLSFVFASHAQQPSLKNADSRPIEEPNSQPVASSNRTSSRDLAKSLRVNSSNKNNEDKDLSRAAALVWVDSNGKTVGKAIVGTPLGIPSAMVVPFENEHAVLEGLDSVTRCDQNGVCTSPLGITWRADKFSLLYTSADCTGTPYATVGTYGTTFKGFPIMDGSETFIYVFKIAQATRVSIKSSFNTTRKSSCASVGPLQINAIPVAAVLPASAFGTEPYFLK